MVKETFLCCVGFTTQVSNSKTKSKFSMQSSIFRNQYLSLRILKEDKQHLFDTAEHDEDYQRLAAQLNIYLHYSQTLMTTVSSGEVYSLGLTKDDKLD